MNFDGESIKESESPIYSSSRTAMISMDGRVGSPQPFGAALEYVSKPKQATCGIRGQPHRLVLRKRLTPASPAGMHDVLQGERLASRKMRVESLQIADGLAASYPGYTPEDGIRVRGRQ